MMERFIWIVMVMALLLMPFGGQRPAAAAEVDVLVKKLVEKGLFTEEEARALLMEMQKESAREDAQVEQIARDTAKQVAQKEAKPLELPGWIKNTKLKGDVRLRYQHEDKDGDDRSALERYRIRYRLYGEHKVTDNWKAGWGIASGGDDPRSTNQTLDDTFSTKDIRLDMAWAQYTPFDWLSLTGGKFKNPIWGTKDLLWDSDIRPEGFAAEFNYKFHPKAKLFFTPGVLVLNEFSDGHDQYLFPFQMGMDWNIRDRFALKVAGAYYAFDNLEGNPALFESAGTNTVDAKGNLLSDYDSYGFDAELGMKTENKILPYVGVFGQWVNNTDAPDGEDTGWLAGVKFGHSKVSKFMDWQFKYNYRHLERDAWPDAFPDSDFYGGSTNVEGHEAEFTFGLAKNVSLGLDWYVDNKPIEGDSDAKLDLLQVDLVLKW